MPKAQRHSFCGDAEWDGSLRPQEYDLCSESVDDAVLQCGVSHTGGQDDGALTGLTYSLP